MGIALNTNSRDNQDERPPGGSGLSIDALGVVLIVLVPAALITSIADRDDLPRRARTGRRDLLPFAARAHARRFRRLP